MSDPKTAFQKMKRLIVLLLRYALSTTCAHTEPLREDLKLESFLHLLF